MAQVALMAAQAGLAGIGSAISAHSQNAALRNQYIQQQKQQKLINAAAIQQFTETVGRNNLNTQTQAASAQDTAMQNILENQRRQATAVASGASNGVTGSPLQMLFNDYQSAIGGVASDLQTQYHQLNAQTFFNNRDAQLSAQSIVNQAVPARPYLQNPLMSGLVGSLGAISSSIGQTGLNFGGNKSNKLKVKPIQPQNLQAPLRPFEDIYQ